MSSGGAATRGFTLIEALVAMTLSAVLIALVTSVFLAQNDFYRRVVTRSQVQESARSVAELVASELRPATRGSVTLAESRRLTVRTPQVVGLICSVSSPTVHTYLPLGGVGVDTTEVSGYGIREVDGSWSFYPRAWGEIAAGSGLTATANNCHEAGMDTVGVRADFYRFDGPADEPSPAPSAGSLLMIYGEVDYVIQASELDAEALGLFRGLSGRTLVEFATGLGADARFEYRLDGESSFQASVTGTDLEGIVVVRLHSIATETRAPPGDPTAFSYGFSLDVPLRNAQ